MYTQFIISQLVLADLNTLNLLNINLRFVIRVHISLTLLRVSAECFSTDLSEKCGIHSTISVPEAHTKVWGKDRPKETYLQPMKTLSLVCS